MAERTTPRHALPADKAVVVIGAGTMGSVQYVVQAAHPIGARHG